MIPAVTPRQTRRLDVPALGALHQVVAALVAPLGVEDARDTVLVVPSNGAAVELRRTIERLIAGRRVPPAVFAQLGMEAPPSRPVLCLPRLVTRAGLYAELHGRLPGPPPLLDEFARDALMRAAASEAEDAGAAAPFTVRPGIVVEMLAFYDAVVRLRRGVDDVERLLVRQLTAEALADRGAARLLQQTKFLLAAYRAFERRCAELDAIDEHGVRARALETGVTPALRHVVLCVGDHVGEPGGLWPADFELLSRLPELARLDVVVTHATLSAGFDERLEQRLPGTTHVPVTSFADRPVLRVPEAQDGVRYSRSRDREEELNLFVRSLKWASRPGTPSPAPPPDEHALVVQRPLPYLYLARHTLDAAGVPWAASDALPLAAEPYAAALDLLGETVLGEGSPGTLLGLLRSPMFRFAAPGLTIGPDEVRVLAEELERARFFGGFDHLCALMTSRVDEGQGAADARARRLGAVAAAVLGAVEPLRAMTIASPLSAHVAALLAWLDRFEAPLPPAFPDAERHARARGAVRAALRRMRESALAHHDPPVPMRHVMATLRRWIEARTFQPTVGHDGVRLLDADAARFSDAASVWLLGLVDGDWPAAGRRDIFYPTSLLADLGWPTEAVRSAAARAQFSDLLHLARATTTVSSFLLEEDAIVEPSVLLEELDTTLLVTEHVVPPPPLRALAEDALWFEPTRAGEPGDRVSPWIAARVARSGADARRFAGQAGPVSRASHAVTHIDTWIECPFRYFARHVLELEDEREDEPGLTPRQRGDLAHQVFERFHQRWAASGRGQVAVPSVAAARAMLAEVVDEVLAPCDPADAAIERTRLLGSAVGGGMGDRVLTLEVERDAQVLERRLEERLDGTYQFAADDGEPRLVAIRGKADRIDLLEGDRLELFDYKTGRAPTGSVQLPVYAHVAEQRLAGHLGRQWRAESADYIAFRGRPVVRSLGRRPEDRDSHLQEAQTALLDAVDAIARGDFPPRPSELRTCSWCPYDAVCRKDYVEADGDGQA